MTKDNILIRRAERQDVPLLLDFIRGIARYEKMENEVIASPEVLCLPSWMAGKWASHSTSTISRRSSGTPGYIWKTCSYGRKIEARVMARLSCCILSE